VQRSPRNAHNIMRFLGKAKLAVSSLATHPQLSALHKARMVLLCSLSQVLAMKIWNGVVQGSYSTNKGSLSSMLVLIPTSFLNYIACFKLLTNWSWKVMDEFLQTLAFLRLIKFGPTFYCMHNQFFFSCCERALGAIGGCSGRRLWRESGCEAGVAVIWRPQFFGGPHPQIPRFMGTSPP
jgi:hypothetical protein